VYGACTGPAGTCQSNPDCANFLACVSNCPADDPATQTNENLDCLCENDGSACTALDAAGTCTGDYQNGISDYIDLATCVNGDDTTDGECTQACAAPSCNPVTGTGCNAATGEACDYGQTGYQCYAPPPPNTAALCASCGPSQWCASEMTCLYTNSAQTLLKCVRYCCNDADCGGVAGSCAANYFGDGVGICATDNGSYVTPKCSGIPASPPSMGTCAP